MLNFLLSAAGAGSSFFEKYGILIVLAVVLGVLMLISYNRRKSDFSVRNELFTKLKPGVSVKTYGGIYGVVEKIEETTDGKIVTLKTGTSDKVSFITMHIEAIYGLDTKEAVVVDNLGNPIIKKDEVDLDKLMEERLKKAEETKATKKVEEKTTEIVSEKPTAKPKTTSTTKKPATTKSAASKSTTSTKSTANKTAAKKDVK